MAAHVTARDQEMNLRWFRTSRTLDRLVAVIAIAALAWHGLMPRMQPVQAAAAELSLEAALNLICTAGGLVDRNQNPIKAPGDSCPLCPIFTSPALAPAQNVTPLPQCIATAVLLVRQEMAGNRLRLSHTVLPRAPPLRIV